MLRESAVPAATKQPCRRARGPARKLQQIMPER
jgi:hypothetical protein